jgi:hypothetical protein
MEQPLRSLPTAYDKIIDKLISKKKSYLVIVAHTYNTSFIGSRFGKITV